jgi:predicted enzyme related to lactoylglutathione lyase
MTSHVSGLLFAKRLGIVSEFYQAVFGVRISSTDAHHAVLDFGGFDLMIHQIPQHLAVAVAVTSPPERREQTAIRLDFPVSDLARSRREAARLGGVIDEVPPPWAGTDATFFLGHDPEGNVFGAKVSSS